MKVQEMVGRQETYEKAKEWRQDENRMAQRRIWVTPTLVLVRPMELNQSNAVLRRMKNLLDYLVRVNILGDDLREQHYNHQMQANILRHFVKPSIKRIEVAGINLEFFAYSASMIKQRSWW